MTVDFIIDEVRENFRIKEFLKKVDTKFYYRAIENKKKEGKVFSAQRRRRKIVHEYLSVCQSFSKEKRGGIIWNLLLSV